MNTEVMMWILVAMGCLPWWISRRVVVVRVGRRRQRLLRQETRAIFWRLTVERPPRGRGAWRLRVPLLERVQQAVWAAVHGLLQ